MPSQRKRGKLGETFSSGESQLPSQASSSKLPFSSELMMGREMEEILVFTGVTHILFPYREDMPLCFLTPKAGRGTKDGRG